MPYLKQAHFSYGELSPQLWGRTDSPRYAGGLRRCENFFVSKTGALISRPGTVYVAEAKTSDVRLIPFVYSDEVSYVLEFGENYIRVFQDGEQLESGGVPLEYATTYLASELPDIQFAQSGDVLYLAHGAHAPATFTRLTDAPTFELADVEFARAALSTWVQHSTKTKTGEGFFVTCDDADPDTYFVGDSDHPPRPWRWAVSGIIKDSSGKLYETSAVDVATYKDTAGDFIAIDEETTFSVYPDHHLILGRLSTATPITGNALVAYNVYRGLGEVLGFIGQTKSLEFVDVGEVPNYALAPLLGTNPFEIRDATDTLIDTEHPSSVCFFEDRLVWGGTESRPSTIIMSATGDYYNYDTPYVPNNSQSLVFRLAARKLERIQSVFPAQRLIVFTDAAVWTVGGYDTSGMSPDGIRRGVLDEVGSSTRRPIDVSGAILYVRRKGRGVRGLMWNEQTYASYVGRDFTSLAGHMFEGPAGDIAEWCYQEDPFGVIWAARGDGVLLSLTYSQENEVLAWARHETDGDVVSVCSVPEGREDAVYLAVSRDGTVLIERMASRVAYGEVDDNVCLDSAIRFSVSPTDTFSGLSRFIGKQVYATTSVGAVYGPFEVTSDSIVLPETPAANFDGDDDGVNDTLVIYIGLPFVPEVETLDVGAPEVALAQKSVTAAAFTVVNSRGLEVGPSVDALQPWRQREVSDDYGSIGYASELVRVPVGSTWNYAGRCVLRQPNPLPLMVTSVTREVSIGG